MSQPGEQTDKPSSAASASVTNATSQVINSDDPAWAHAFCPDLTKKHHVQCKYCDKKSSGGITRMKYHLAGIKGKNIGKCGKVPTPVKEEIIALLSKKSSEKEQKAKEKERDISAIDIDHSDDDSHGEEDSEHGNEVLVLKSNAAKRSDSSKSVASCSPIEKYYKPPSIEESVHNMQKGVNVGTKVQTKLSTQKREERRDRVCEYICQFFYEAGIPHNAVTLDSFAYMLEAIGQFGRGLRGPSPYEMSGPFLQKRKQKVLEGFKNHKESWELTGCTVMTDAWTDRKGRGIMNLVVHSAHGVIFLDSVDCSGERKDGKYIFELVDKCIDDIGEEHVVQVVTDNASVNTTASNLLRAKRPSIFWNGCITKMVDDEATQDNIIEELNMYQGEQGSFGQEIAIRQRRNKNLNPAKWWLNHGTCTPNLRILASRILNLTCSSSACERNWSVFEQIHTKKRNKLLHDRMRDLVFVKFNSKLRNKKDNKGRKRDPLEKEIDDVVADNGNEFITGIIPLPSEVPEQVPQAGASQGESRSQAQPKRKRPVRPRKKMRSLQSLMRDASMQPVTSSSESEDDDDDVAMQSSDSE